MSEADRVDAEFLKDKVYRALRRAAEASEPTPTLDDLTYSCSSNHGSVQNAIEKLRKQGKIRMVYHPQSRLTRRCEFPDGRVTAWTVRKDLVGTKRPCLTCSAPMLSTGHHHRLCDPCRRNA